MFSKHIHDDSNFLAAPYNTQSHRIFVIDCSGSMCLSDALIRTHLKNKIPTLTKPSDFVSIIFFQHEGAFGCVKEHVQVNDLQQVQELSSSIDRYLVAGGGTYFTEAITLANTLANKYDETPQIFFLTDGCENNQHTSTRDAFAASPASVVLVEYGHYVDHKYIQSLAEACNGVVLFNKQFERLGQSIDTHLTNTVVPKAKCKTFHTGSPMAAAFVVVNNEVATFKANAEGVISVPEGCTVFLWNGQVNANEQLPESFSTSDTYLALLFAVKIKHDDLVMYCLRQLGDVALVDKYVQTFTRQEYTELEDTILQAYRDPSRRYVRGMNRQYIPKEDAFTIVQLLDILSKDDKARMYPYSEDFTYSRISKKVTPKEVFVPNKGLGCSFTLVHNNSRANISLNCKVFGHKVSEDGEVSPSHSYRNFAVVKDGIKNVPRLPMSISKETYDTLCEVGVIEVGDEWKVGKVFVLPLETIPVTNRAMTRGQHMSVTTFATYHVKKLQLMAQRKYINSRLKQLNALPVEGDAGQPDEHDGEEEKGNVERVRDLYMSKELLVKIAKCSSLPTVNEKLLSKLSAKNKLTMSERLMEGVHDEWEVHGVYDVVEWAKGKLVNIASELASLAGVLEQIKFNVLACGLWFNDVNAVDNEEGKSETSVGVDGCMYDVTVMRGEKIIYLD